MQKRLPGRRRCRDLQIRISFSLLRRPHAPAQRLRLRQHRSVGPSGIACARSGQPLHPTSVSARHLKTQRRNPPAARPYQPSPQRLSRTWFERTRAPWKGGASAPRGAFEKERALAPEGTVLLWPDTFNNYFHPATANAAVEVLEAAGFRVTVPKAHLCCGRPLYDHGMLNRAQSSAPKSSTHSPRKSQPAFLSSASSPAALPSSATNFSTSFPTTLAPKPCRRQTFLLSEFLESHAPNFALPQLNRKALLHGHCHQKSLMKMTAERIYPHSPRNRLPQPRPRMLRHGWILRLRARQIRHLHAIGELELLPAVRQAPARLAYHRQRLQLPRANRARHEPPCAASGRGPTNGPARRVGRSRPVPYPESDPRSSPPSRNSTAQ